MDIRDLNVFLHLCDSCNYSVTAKAMYLSPSTLSRQIQRLEHEIGQPLFIRDNRSVSITEAGLKVKLFAQQSLAHYQQLQISLDENNHVLTGELRLFCSVTAAYSHLPDILDKFRARYPRVEIKLSTGDAADAVNKIQLNEADIALAGRPKLLPNSIEFLKVGEITMVMLMPKMHSTFSEKLHTAKPDWNNIPFILPKHGPSRNRIDQWFKQNKITNPKIYATVAGHEAIVSMVALGCGISLLPKVVMNNSPERIRERVIEWSDNLIEPFDLGVCTQKRRLSEKIISAFWALCE